MPMRGARTRPHRRRPRLRRCHRARRTVPAEMRRRGHPSRHRPSTPVAVPDRVEPGSPSDPARRARARSAAARGAPQHARRSIAPRADHGRHARRSPLAQHPRRSSEPEPERSRTCADLLLLLLRIEVPCGSNSAGSSREPRGREGFRTFRESQSAKTEGREQRREGARDDRSECVRARASERVTERETAGERAPVLGVSAREERARARERAAERPPSDL